MTRIITSLLLALFLLMAVTVPASATGDLTITHAELEDKVVIKLEGIETDGWRLRIFTNQGKLIENKLLSPHTTSYEMLHPDKGMYWLSLKNGDQTTFKLINIQ
ncbi:T9SS type A sorting domain-containing protein [bacterium]|nr:T9SS type A sorting domain-containing protein [bacterium]